MVKHPRSTAALTALATAAVVLLGACEPGGEDFDPGSARITFSVAAPTQPATATGRMALGDAFPGSILYVPTTYTPDVAAPLMVLLHGRAGTPENTLTRADFTGLAEARGMLLVVPKSTDVGWDIALNGQYGEDPKLLERVLKSVSERYRVDGARLVLAGFSDGAGYALSVGVSNGDIFRRIVAFSPGYVLPTEQNGRPPIFLSHGRQDTVLPFATSGDRIQRTLVQQGYTVTFVPFEGGHEVPEDIARQGFDFALMP